MLSLHKRYVQQSLAMYGGGTVFSLLLFAELWCASMLQRADTMSAWIGYIYPALMVGMVVGNALGRGEAIRVSSVIASQSHQARTNAYRTRNRYVSMYALCIGVCVFFAVLVSGVLLPDVLVPHASDWRWACIFLLWCGILIWARSCFFLALWVYVSLGKIKVFTRFTLMYLPLQVFGMGMISQIAWSKDSWMGMFALVGVQWVGLVWLYVVIYRYAERRLGCVLLGRPALHAHDFFKVFAGGASSAAEGSYLALMWMILHAVGTSIRSDYLLVVPIIHRVENICVSFINPMIQSTLSSMTYAFSSSHWLRYRFILRYMTRYALGVGIMCYLGFWLLEKHFVGLFSSSDPVLEGLQPIWMWAVTAVFQSVCFIYLNARHTSVGRYALAWKVNALRLFALLLGLWLLLSLEFMGLEHVWVVLCVSQFLALAVSFSYAMRNILPRT